MLKQPKSQVSSYPLNDLTEFPVVDAVPHTIELKSDLDLLLRVELALSLRQEPAIRRLKATVHWGEATLSGDVPSFSLRQRAVELVKHLPGVRRVHDEIAVVDPRHSPDVPTLLQGAGRNADHPGNAWRLTAQTVSRRRITAAFAALVGFAVGCGNDAAERAPVFPAHGSLSVKGQPAHGALVVLHPRDSTSGAPSPRANVDAQGRFVVSTYDAADGAPAGEYVVTVNWYKLVKDKNDVRVGPNVIPRKYGTPQSSDIVVRIAAGENQLPPIKL